MVLPIVSPHLNVRPKMLSRSAVSQESSRPMVELTASETGLDCPSPRTFRRRSSCGFSKTCRAFAKWQKSEKECLGCVCRVPCFALAFF